MAGRQWRNVKKPGVTIGHAVDTHGTSEGCGVMWVQNERRTGQQSSIVDCNLMLSRDE